MSPKERIDKRAKEMHKPILKEVKRLEGEIVHLKSWVAWAREVGTCQADRLFEKQGLKIP